VSHLGDLSDLSDLGDLGDVSDLGDLSQTADRLRRAQEATSAAGLDALLVTPGPDLAYLSGYDAVALERLTCLLVPATGEPSIVVPLLEAAAAAASPIGALGLAIHPWAETEDPYAMVAGLLASATSVALDDRMWAAKVLSLREAMPAVEQRRGGPVISALRMRKTAAEVAALRAAGQAIDAVHARMHEWLRPGRSEREVAADIAEAILATGHRSVDFVIVASGPNGASPHHEVSERVIETGDAVVVDIGGTMASGYCSDSTRVYATGQPKAQFLAAYQVLQAAQEAACRWARPGVSCASVDAAARQVIEAAGYGELFIHRTGHGIGLETHEEPYIVTGNQLLLEPGMAFSVEPGIYLTGSFGARIEDIVVCTESGAERLNHRPRELVVLEG
jgi:Xaa-Pro aminopeptidase